MNVVVRLCGLRHRHHGLREKREADVVAIFQAVDADLGNLLDGYLFVASDLR